jgi:hypothetical protein
MLPWKWLQCVHKNVKMQKTMGVKGARNFRYYLAAELAAGATIVALQVEDGNREMEA